MSFNVKSLVNIPREKKTMEITNAKEGYLVLTKTNFLLYLLPAYLRSTPLVVLVLLGQKIIPSELPTNPWK